jgi:predicted ATP-grasp superfamily ATP-dependent carboligase
MPYDRDREISCVYSLRTMKKELTDYAVKFSNYEGGTTIGTYLIDKAEHRDVEFLAFYAFVPAYDFGQLSLSQQQGIRIETDFKAWYDLMRRFNHMFHLDIDLSELEKESEDLVISMETKIEEMGKEIPQLNIKEYMDKVGEEFIEMTFMPLDDVWERELGNLFDDE